MGLIGNDRIAALGKRGTFIQRIEQRRERLNSDDDNASIARQRFGQLFGFTLVANIAGNGANHPMGMFKLVNGVLQLAI